MRRRTAGFTFIEILVVTGIIIVLMGMVAVLVPVVIQNGQRTESLNNVRSLATMLSHRSLDRGWPRLDGKAFTLAPVAMGLVDARNRDNLEVLFAAGDPLLSVDAVEQDRYATLTLDALRVGLDVHDLTSWAGRRNTDRNHLLTSNRLKQGVPILCDDDDGPLHDADGLVMAFPDGRAGFYEWADLGMPPPEEPDDPAPFLGDDAADTRGWLGGLSSR